MAKTTTERRTLQDFPEYVEAKDKFDDLQAQLDAARNELSDAQRQSAGAHAAAVEHAEALSLLGDSGGVAVAVRPLDEIQRDVRIRTIAVDAQKRVVEDIATRIERQETESVEIDVHKSIVQAMYAALAKLQTEMAALQMQQASIHQRFGRCSLPTIGLSQRFMATLPHAQESLRAGCEHYGISVKE